MRIEEFQQLMNEVADGWNNKKAQKAAECFTENAVYVEPPDKQLFQGRNQLYEYFGGDSGFDMKLTWHNILFNEKSQTGAGEYTFEFNDKTHHGMVFIELTDNLISLWREYDTTTDLTYEEFTNIDKKFTFTIKNLKS